MPPARLARSRLLAVCVSTAPLLSASASHRTCAYCSDSTPAWYRRDRLQTAHSRSEPARIHRDVDSPSVLHWGMCSAVAAVTTCCRRDGAGEGSSAQRSHHAVPVVQAPPQPRGAHPRQDPDADVGRQGDGQDGQRPEEYQEPCTHRRCLGHSERSQLGSFSELQMPGGFRITVQAGLVPVEETLPLPIAQGRMSRSPSCLRGGQPSLRGCERGGRCCGASEAVTRMLHLGPRGRCRRPRRGASTTRRAADRGPRGSRPARRARRRRCARGAGTRRRARRP